MKKKNQHYVPQFHLRQWSNDGKLISLYNKYNKIFVDNKGAIKNLASRNYMYDKNGAMEDLLGDIESHLSPLYQKIIKDVSLTELTEFEWDLLYLHFILSNDRTNAAGKDYEELIKTQLESSLKLYQAHGRYMGINVDDIKENVGVEFSCNRSIKNAFKYYPIIMDLKISLIQNMSNVEFVTSDYPSIKYNLWSNKRKLYTGWGMSSVGIMYILPICPQFALIAYDPVVYNIKNLKNNIVRINNDADINEINRLMIINSDENIFFSANIPLHYINRLISPIKEHIKRPNTVQTLGNNEYILIANNVRKINYIANLRFLSVLPESLEWYVPSNAVGLLRPTSEDIAKQIGIELDADKK